jgi:hypothetical protein
MMDRVQDVEDVVRILGKDVLVVIKRVKVVVNVVQILGKIVDVGRRVFLHPVLIVSL